MGEWTGSVLINLAFSNGFQGSIVSLSIRTSIGASPKKRLMTALDNMRLLAKSIGDPQSDFPTIHITGTKFIVSTSAVVSKLLTAMGLTVGTYCSPHVSSITERIQINTEPISNEEFSELVHHLKIATSSRLDITPSWFELLTAAAFFLVSLSTQ